MLPFPQLVQYGNTIAPPPPIKKVETGVNFIMVLTSTGKLYARGVNSSGQHGDGTTATKMDYTLVRSGVNNVWCGYSGTLIQDNDGKYYQTGNMRINSSTTNQTFTDCTAVFNTLPLSSNVTIQQMVLSTNSSGSSVLVLLSSGALYGCGTNAGNEITGTGTQYGSFKLISTPTVPIKIFGGYESTAYIDASQGFYYTGFFKGRYAGTTSTRVTAYTGFAPAGTSNYKVQNYYSTTNQTYMYVYNIASSAYLMLAGGEQFFGAVANGQNTSTIIAMAAIDTGTYDTPVLSLFNGLPYYGFHIVTNTRILAAGQNNTSTYIGKMGINSTANALTFTQVVLPGGVTDLANVSMHHCFNRTYLLDYTNGLLYGSGQDVTYNNTTPSNVYTLDMSGISA